VITLSEGARAMREEEQRSVVTMLSAKYPIFAVSTIQRWVAIESGRYSTAKIQKYIPVLVQRSVEATLSELASREGTSSGALTLDVADRVDVTPRAQRVLQPAEQANPLPRR
jgi:hypothetical protein